MKFLIGEISSYKAIVICRYIKQHYPVSEIITYDFKPFTRYVRTKYSNRHYVLKYSNKENELAELIKIEEIECFIPVMSSEMELVLGRREMFGSSLFYLGEFESYRKLHYKNKLMELADSLCVRIPIQYRNINEAVPPFIIKPVNAASAAGVKYIMNEDDKSVLAGINEGEVVIQEYIKGFGAGYSLFCRNGNIISGFGHKRIAEYPVTGGSSVYRTNYQNPEMFSAAGAIISALNWSGFCMFEFKINDREEAYLIEANPRIWGSIYQGLANGVNYFEGLLGPAENNSGFGVNTYLSPLIYRSLAGYLLKGNFAPVRRFLQDKKRKPDISILDDPGGYLNLIAKKLRFNLFDSR